MTLDALCAPRYSPELDIVVRELDQLQQQLFHVTQDARGLTAVTDWHARSARAFHEKAETWAGSVARLLGLAESARLEAVRAREVARARIETSCR